MCEDQILSQILFSASSFIMHLNTSSLTLSTYAYVLCDTNVITVHTHIYSVTRILLMGFTYSLSCLSFLVMFTSSSRSPICHCVGTAGQRKVLAIWWTLFNAIFNGTNKFSVLYWASRDILLHTGTYLYFVLWGCLKIRLHQHESRY